MTLNDTSWLLWAAVVFLAVGAYQYRTDLRECQMRVERIALPPCETCTRPQPRVYTAGTPYTLTTHVAECVEHPEFGCLD